MGSCSVEENPNFLNSENLFSDVDGAQIALNGVYAGLASHGYYASEYFHALNWTSGMYNTNKQGSLKDIVALNPSPNDKNIGNLWGGLYLTISRANNVIAQLNDNDLGNAEVRNNILGQAMFIRAYAYFDLARVFGRAPLILEPLTSTNPNHALAPNDQLYAQIISDGEEAVTLMSDKTTTTAGRPSKYAANMLMAKVYMWLAGDTDNTELWQKANDHAIQVYQQYELVENFRDLWQDNSRNNTVESIFEIQANIENSLKLIKYWSASNANIGRSTFGRFKPNLEVYDRHLNTYPEDPRIKYTFKTEFIKYKSNGSTSTVTCYPTFTNRDNKDKSYPYGYKYFIQNTESVNTDSDINYVAYRYADLLLMLAEITNELSGPDNAYQYVNQVLNRARNSGETPSAIPADWSGMDASSFRDAITLEYIFELQQEGQDFFNVRRRGYDYFREFVINAHNDHPLYDFSKAKDVDFTDNDRIMFLPIPELEILANDKISASDQNPGY